MENEVCENCGREITESACKHLGLKYHKRKDTSDQPALFDKGQQ